MLGLWLLTGTSLAHGQVFEPVMPEVVNVLENPFPYEAKEVGVEAMLQDLTRKTQVPVIVSKPIGGKLTLSNQDGSVRDALNMMSDQGQGIWWFDGSAVHVEPPGSIVSQLIGLDGITVTQLRDQMRAVGLENEQFPLRADANAEMVRIVAPQGYVDAVAELITHMVESRNPETGGHMPRIIRGRSQLQ
ncbi:type III secretion protein C [Paracoccus sulfuroxidans]|uniref:Type III secretion protein C n=1 Tax=Paracoccus sulfuroxidans TaxID=384678 RepID=A0A562NSF5_9RHOB|nr:type III secretion protein C [Paracoccus sulfuroxidans]